jgi:predicted transcriptional regulator
MTTIATPTSTIDLTASIASAYLARNDAAPEHLSGIISSIYGALTSLGTTPEPEPAAAPEPAVSIRASVKPDAIACLCCGTKGKMLKRHLQTAHGLTPAEYRTMWSLPATYPMVAPDYAEKRRELAVQIGLGRKPGAKVAKGAGRQKKAA